MQIDKPKEVIDGTVNAYIDQYTKTYGRRPTQDHINKIIQDLESLAIEKERTDLIERYSNWTAKDIREVISAYRARSGKISEQQIKVKGK